MIAAMIGFTLNKLMQWNALKKNQHLILLENSTAKLLIFVVLCAYVVIHTPIINVFDQTKNWHEIKDHLGSTFAYFYFFYFFQSPCQVTTVSNLWQKTPQNFTELHSDVIKWCPKPE